MKQEVRYRPWNRLTAEQMAEQGRQVLATWPQLSDVRRHGNTVSFAGMLTSQIRQSIEHTGGELVEASSPERPRERAMVSLERAAEDVYQYVAKSRNSTNARQFYDAIKRSVLSPSIAGRTVRFATEKELDLTDGRPGISRDAIVRLAHAYEVTIRSAGANDRLEEAKSRAEELAMGRKMRRGFR